MDNLVRLVIIVSFLILLPFRSCGEEMVKVEMISEASIGSEVIRVRDIAKITPKNEEVGDFIIAWTPSIGTQRKLSRLQVANKMKNRFSFPISLTGANYTRVTRGKAELGTITREGLRKKVVNLLLNRRPDLIGKEDGIEFFISGGGLPMGRVKDIDIRFGNVESDIISGRILFNFGEHYRRTISFRLKGRIEKEVIKTVRYIKKGEVLKKSDFYTDYVIGGLGRKSKVMDKIPDNVEARVNIREGVPISQDMFIPHYTIKIGDRFLLHSGNKRIQLEVSVEAVENGNIGDIIKVKNLSSGRVVKGLIKSEDNVCSVTE
jgi:flagella basal body P-ring formation protein FlgA